MRPLQGRFGARRDGVFMEQDCSATLSSRLRTWAYRNSRKALLPRAALPAGDAAATRERPSTVAMAVVAVVVVIVVIVFVI
jgi:hypothetical protein